MAEPAPPRQPAAPYSMVSIPFAQSAALDAAVALTLPSEVVPLAQSLNRVLAEDLVATSPLPPFAASIKDGYAVRSSELADAFANSKSSTSTSGDPLVFRVAFEALAGASPPPLPSGTVAYISTGAPLPEGADAVVQIEDTEVVRVKGDGGEEGDGINKSNFVRFRSIAEGKTKPPLPGGDVRAPGSDLAPGTVVLSQGEKIGPAEIGLAATVGVGALGVFERPLVAVLSTGDELIASGGDPGPQVTIPPSEPLPAGAIRDANRPLLLSAAEDAGARVLDLGIAADDEASTDAAVERALSEGAHVLVVSGGVSMGDRDFVKPALEKKGRVHFGRVNMKPGKPLTFATLPRDGGLPLLAFGLPGNPASAAVTFALVVGPVLRALSGWNGSRGSRGKEESQESNIEGFLPRRIFVTLDRVTPTDASRPEYARASLRWEGGSGGREGGEGKEEEKEANVVGHFVATNTGNQISSRLLSMKGADVLLELPAGGGVFEEGKVVSALVYRDLRDMIL